MRCQDFQQAVLDTWTRGLASMRRKGPTLSGSRMNEVTSCACARVCEVVDRARKNIDQRFDEERTDDETTLN
jgi:hypothetical protein